MLVVLMALKTLELRARRDAMVVFLLGFFLVLTHFLYSQSLLTALAMLVSVWGLLTALVLAHMPVGQPALRAGRRRGRARGAAGRADHDRAVPAVPAHRRRCGACRRTPAGAPGCRARWRWAAWPTLANDDSIALRVRFSTAARRRREALYFRGPVLSGFDGREWQRARPALRRPAATRRPSCVGAPLRYEMTLEPSRLALLPLLELTARRARAARRWPRFRVPPAARHAVDRRPPGRRAAARAGAGLDPLPARPEGPDARRCATALRPAAGRQPAHAGLGRRAAHRADLRDAAAERAGGGGAGRTSAAPASPTRWSPGPTAATPSTSSGSTASWASASTSPPPSSSSCARWTCRRASSPATRAADPQPVDGYYVVRQSNAHAWAEFWQPAARAGCASTRPPRWRPTACALGRSLRAPQGLVAGTLHAVNPALVATAARRLGADGQPLEPVGAELLARASSSTCCSAWASRRRSWEDLAYALIGLLSGVSLAGAAWALWDRHRQDPWQRLQQRVRERLALLGVARGRRTTRRARGRGVCAQRSARPATRWRGRWSGWTTSATRVGARRRPDPRWWRQFERRGGQGRRRIIELRRISAAARPAPCPGHLTALCAPGCRVGSRPPDWRGR